MLVYFICGPVYETERGARRETFLCVASLERKGPALLVAGRGENKTTTTTERDFITCRLERDKD